jgi:chromosome segregation ATPase
VESYSTAQAEGSPQSLSTTGERMKKDYTNHLPSLRRQNVKLLKEREVLRDEIRTLSNERDSRSQKITELWGVLTDIRNQISQTIIIGPAQSGKDWVPLQKAVEKLVSYYIQLDVENVRFLHDIEDLKIDKNFLEGSIAYEKNRSIFDIARERISAFFSRKNNKKEA